MDGTMSVRPSVLQATRSIDAQDDLAIRLKACRGIVREAARRVAVIAVGCHVEGVEEVEFADRLENALHDYLASRSDPTKRRAYIDNTRGMDEIVASLKRVPAAVPAITTAGAGEPSGSEEEGRTDG